MKRWPLHGVWFRLKRQTQTKDNRWDCNFLCLISTTRALNAIVTGHTNGTAHTIRETKTKSISPKRIDCERYLFDFHVSDEKLPTCTRLETLLWRWSKCPVPYQFTFAALPYEFRYYLFGNISTRVRDVRSPQTHRSQLKKLFTKNHRHHCVANSPWLLTNERELEKMKFTESLLLLTCHQQTCIRKSSRIHLIKSPQEKQKSLFRCQWNAIPLCL